MRLDRIVIIALSRQFTSAPMATTSKYAHRARIRLNTALFSPQRANNKAYTS